MLRIVALAATGGLALGVGPAAAEPAGEAALSPLAACAPLAEPVGKAACYDAAYAALREAVRTGEVVIVEKREAQAAQRGAFGLSIPSFQIFDRATGGQALESVTGEVAQARRDENGRWVVTLTEGAVWRQIDNGSMRAPRPGAPVEIRKAAFGSFMMKVDGQRGVRARRDD